MLKTLTAVENGTPIKATEKALDVPRTTLADNVHGRSAIQRKMELQSVLSKECCWKNG